MSLKKTSNQAEALTQAHVILMEREVVSRARQPDEFRLLNNQYNALQNWHDQYTGWRIRRTPAVIRLVRTPAAFIPGYQFRTLQQPRDFACFVWTLWYSETRLSSGRGNEQQFLMSQLAERLEEHSAGGYLAPHVAALDFKRQSDRYSLSRALKTLQDLGGLQLVDGSSEEWVNQTGQENALWEFTDAARSLILALDMTEVTLAGRALDGNPHSLNPARLPGAEKLNPQQRAWRTLLLGPVLLRYDDPEAFAALLEHQETIGFELGNTFGWQLDVRHEYAMIIRASGTSQGPVSLLNLTGAADQAALLCASVIRQKIVTGEWRYPPVEGCYVVPESEVADIFRQLREQYGQRWGSTARKTSFIELLQEVYASMRQAGLVRGPDRHGNLLILPTVARFAAAYPPEIEETAPLNLDGSSETISTNGKTAKNAPVADQMSFGEFLPDGQPQPDERTYSAGEAGKRLGVSDQSILNWLRSGYIQGQRHERSWLIPAREVERVARLRHLSPNAPEAKRLEAKPAQPAQPAPPPANTPAPVAGQTYTASELARMLGLAAWTIMRWIGEGKVKAERDGRNWLIRADEAERLRRERYGNPANPTPAPPVAPPVIKPAAETQTYSATEAGQLLGVTGWTIASWINKGIMRGEKNGPNWIVPASEVERIKREKK